jgi:hypothetical protein
MPKEQFQPHAGWFKNFKVRTDLGYQKFAQYCKCRDVYIPFKGRKKLPLNEEQKLSNRQLSSQRIVIETQPIKNA